MFLRETRAALPFTLALRGHHQSHPSQAGTAGQTVLLLKNKAQVQEEERLCEDFVFGRVFAEDESLFCSQPNSMKILSWEYAKNFLFISQSTSWLWNKAPASFNFVSWIIHLVLRSVNCNVDNFELAKVNLIQQQSCSMGYCPLYCQRATQALGFVIPFPALHLKRLLAKSTPFTQIPVVFETHYIMLKWTTWIKKIN